MKHPDATDAANLGIIDERRLGALPACHMVRHQSLDRKRERARQGGRGARN